MFDIQRNLLAYVFIFSAFIGVGILFIEGVKAGRIYFVLTSLAIFAIVLYFFFAKEEEERGIEIPFSTSLLQACSWFFIGLLIPTIINILPLKFKTFQLIRLFAIFSSVDSGALGQTFNVIKIQLDPFWDFFLTVWTAGILEVFIFGFATVLFGFIVAKLVRNLLHLKYSKSGDRVFDFIIAMAFSTAFFVLAHIWNQSYTLPIMFLFVAIFGIVRNISLYYINLAFLFFVGIHMSNNWWAMGWQAAMAGILTLKGLPIIILISLMLVYLIINYKKVPKTLVSVKPGL